MEKTFIKNMIVLAILAASSFCSAAVKPNIVLIMTDDQGYFDLSCHGNPVIKTPNIDKFHSESTRFTQFHVSSSCAPTRAALMTGKHPFRSGVTHTVKKRERLSLNSITIADILKQAGYTSGIFGKWHLGDDSEYRPDNRGFDEALIHGAGGLGQVKFGDHSDNKTTPYDDPTLYHNGDFVKKQGYCTDIFFAEALSWMRKQKEANTPFFCYIPTNAPHGPDICDDKYSDPYEEKVPTPKYYGMIANIDENIGKFMTSLKTEGLEKNTLVIFMTDNGHPKKKKWECNAGQKGGKITPYQGGIRVPCFFRWTGYFKAGIDIDKLAAHIDILPTLAELAGAKIPAQAKIEGMSLLPLLKDEKAPWPKRTLYTHNGRWKTGSPKKYGGSAIRTGDHKLVNDNELYNIKDDPQESENLFRTKPELAEQLLQEYNKWWDSVQQDIKINEPGT
jgi:arylsulfatase